MIAVVSVGGMTMICGSVGFCSGLVGWVGCFWVCVCWGLGCCSVSGFWVVGVVVGGRCSRIVMPLIVRREPIQTMMPRNIECMHAVIMEGIAWPSVRIKSAEPMSERLWVR